MSQQTYMKVSGIIFGLVALVHLGRLVRGWALVLGSHSVPTWASGVGLVVAGYLAFTAFKKGA